MHKNISITLALALCTCASYAQVTLVEFDFAGSGGVGTYSTTNGQFTTINSAVTFDDPTNALTAVNAWAYDGTKKAAANGDLINSNTFGSTSRFDLDLGYAAPGFSYTITAAEVDIRANNESGATFVFGYRREIGVDPKLVGSETINTQSGSDPISTYTIDLSSESLTATATGIAWDTTGSGELRFTFYDAIADDGQSDNFQVDAIRLIGTVTAIPEPSSFSLNGSLLALCAVMLRRRK